jgi:hypothetical protein
VRTKEQDRERKRRKYAENPAEARKKDADRKRANPAWAILTRAKRRAAQVGVPFDLTSEDIDIPEVCPILGIPIDVQQGGARGPKDNSISLDRIVPELGYVRGNIAVISLSEPIASKMTQQLPSLEPSQIG